MEGGLVAGDSPYFLWLVPVLGHSVCVNIVNSVYSRLAEWCTDLENHRYYVFVGRLNSSVKPLVLQFRLASLWS